MPAVPIDYPPDLPITERREEILEAIRDHQVVILAGETGSGKSTQIPKMCLELGRGDGAWIGHTQPRRIAARSVAERVASELGEAVGATVGYAVRFSDKVSSRTKVKVMTDGILLAEIQRDRTLERYDTIIIDEAHERSLNIDFLLGYLKQLLPRRPDLKVIVTSATIDTARFSAHFDDAPIIEVSGRTFPVEHRYRPLDADPDQTLDQAEGIAEAVRELWFDRGPIDTSGDILVFCSGEREIRDAATAIDDLGLSGLETLPLYARLSASEQHKVFAAHQSRRVVIATNVAETSLTVPGIRSVIDTGLARISRFSNRTKVQRLPIEPVSRASADQRSGRCGRVAPGVCIRLYSEDDYLARPEFTEPEIQRTNLASVILQMASLGLGSIEDFPFVEPPDHRSIRDGIAVLEELDAVDPADEGTREWLTPTGRRLARLPLDPRLGRMILEAGRNGCLREVLVIAAGLSIQDPRERPSDKREAADESHRRFGESGSDFLALFEVWTYLRKQQRSHSSGQFRRLCRREFLHHQRFREWEDIERQLRRVARDLDLHLNDQPAHPDVIHRSLLAGLLSQIGMRDDPAKGKSKAPKSGRKPRAEYIGARNARFVVAPGSASSGGAWVMAGELVETNRLWARMVARIDPAWLEEAADHLVKHVYTEARWDSTRGTAVATERVTLWGLPVVPRRVVNLSRVNPELARELFIHHALVEPDWPAGHEFLERAFMNRNAETLEAARELQAKARNRSVEDEVTRLTAFFERRLGDAVVSVGHFNRWWKKQPDDVLDLALVDLVDEAAMVDVAAFPPTWEPGGYDISYAFDAASPVDGIVIDLPLSALAAADAAAFGWHVPGFRQELVEQLIRTLPKDLRKALVPVPETAAAIVDELVPDGGAITVRLATALARSTGVAVTPEAFDPSRLDKHLRPTFRVVGPDGTTVGAGKDLDSLRRRLAGSLHQRLLDQFGHLCHPGSQTWDLGDVPERVEHDGLVGYPGLVDRGDAGVGVEVYATESEQATGMWTGTRKLLRFQLRQPAKTIDRQLPDRTKLALAAGPVQSRVAWYNDAIAAAVDDLLARKGGPVRDAEAFVRLAASVRSDAGSKLATAAESIRALIQRHDEIQELLDARRAGFPASVADAEAHLARLLYPGVLEAVGLERHDDLVRYLDALAHRLDVLPEAPGRDRDTMSTVSTLEAEYRRAASQLPPELNEDVSWLLEEYRVSLFAPRVGARQKVSAKRIRSLLHSAVGATPS